VANNEKTKAMSDNQFLTVQETARLYNKSVQTVYRNIKAGKLSRQDNGLIALSECLRVYGAMPAGGFNPINNDMANNANNDVITLLQAQIDRLERDLQDLKREGLEREQQAIKREERLMALLQNQSSGGGLFGKLFGK
jgi:DNA invertase Pin-like site-specific DNA recombinase